MILCLSLVIGLFNLHLLVSKIGRWFFELVLLILLKASSDFGNLFLLMYPLMTLHMIKNVKVHSRNHVNLVPCVPPGLFGGQGNICFPLCTVSMLVTAAC